MAPSVLLIFLKLRSEYLAEPVISRVSPSSGPETGGSRVYVSGVNLGSHGAVMCEFGSASHRVKAVHKSETLLYCDSPGHEPGQVNVRLSSNGQQYSTSHGVFTYVGVHSVHAVSPSSGSINGGTTVAVEGVGFLESSLLSCKFGQLLPLFPLLFRLF